MAGPLDPEAALAAFRRADFDPAPASPASGATPAARGRAERPHVAMLTDEFVAAHRPRGRDQPARPRVIGPGGRRQDPSARGPAPGGVAAGRLVRAARPARSARFLGNGGARLHAFPGEADAGRGQPGDGPGRTPAGAGRPGMPVRGPADFRGTLSARASGCEPGAPRRRTAGPGSRVIVTDARGQKIRPGRPAHADVVRGLFRAAVGDARSSGPRPPLADRPVWGRPARRRSACCRRSFRRAGRWKGCRALMAQGGPTLCAIDQIDALVSVAHAQAGSAAEEDNRAHGARADRRLRRRRPGAARRVASLHDGAVDLGGDLGGADQRALSPFTGASIRRNGSPPSTAPRPRASWCRRAWPWPMNARASCRPTRAFRSPPPPSTPPASIRRAPCCRPARRIAPPAWIRAAWQFAAFGHQ